MVNFFEEITEELNDYERLTISPLIVKGLSMKIGKENVITNGEMRKGLLNKYSIKISDARMRKIIQYIRLGGFVERLIATSKGYYVSENKEELLQYEESLMQRAASIEEIAKQINFQTRKKYG